MLAGCAAQVSVAAHSKGLADDQHILTGGHSFVSLFFTKMGGACLVQHMYYWEKRKSGIHFAGHAIQLNNFNKGIIRNYIKWARVFIKFVEKNMNAVKYILVTTSS